MAETKDRGERRTIRGGAVSIYGRMECPGCTKISAIKWMDERGIPVYLHEHQATAGESCPVIEAGSLQRWHEQRMRARIVEPGTLSRAARGMRTPPGPVEGSLPSDPAAWLASLHRV